MKIYTDTYAIGGCFDEEFKEWSVALFDEFKVGKIALMLSDLTMQEVELAPQEIKDKVQEVNEANKIIIGITNEAIHLAETYINEGALTNKSYNDALHCARHY